MTESWREAVLNNMPHGEEGSLELKWDAAITVQKILIENGYAVCMTAGGFEDTYRIAWVYAGDVDNLKYADYDNVVFSSLDYLEDYPEAVYHTEDDEESDDEPEDGYESEDVSELTPEDYAE